MHSFYSSHSCRMCSACSPWWLHHSKRSICNDHTWLYCRRSSLYKGCSCRSTCFLSTLHISRSQCICRSRIALCKCSSPIFRQRWTFSSMSHTSGVCSLARRHFRSRYVFIYAHGTTRPLLDAHFCKEQALLPYRYQRRCRPLNPSHTSCKCHNHNRASHSGSILQQVLSDWNIGCRIFHCLAPWYLTQDVFQMDQI